MTIHGIEIKMPHSGKVSRSISCPIFVLTNKRKKIILIAALLIQLYVIGTAIYQIIF